MFWLCPDDGDKVNNFDFVILMSRGGWGTNKMNLFVSLTAGSDIIQSQPNLAEA